MTKRTPPYSPEVRVRAVRMVLDHQGKGRSPDVVLRERPKAQPELAKPVTKPPDPDALPKALKVVAAAEEVSLADTLGRSQGGFSTKPHLHAEGGRKPVTVVLTAG